MPENDALRDRGGDLEAKIKFTVTADPDRDGGVVKVAADRLDGDNHQTVRVLASGSGPLGA